MKDLSAGLLEIKITEEENKVTMTWLGECIDIDPATVLNPYLDDIVKNLTKEKEFEIDFSRLQYMKSKTLPYLAKFISKLNKKKIKTKVAYDTDLNWQIVTFKGLKFL